MTKIEWLGIEFTLNVVTRLWEGSNQAIADVLNALAWSARDNLTAKIPNWDKAFAFDTVAAVGDAKVLTVPEDPETEDNAIN